MGKIIFKKSTNPHKKYDAFIGTKRVSFGDRNYQQFHDKIGHWSHLDHNDPERRKKYRARHGKIYTKSGELAYKVKYSPEWFSWHYLW